MLLDSGVWVYKEQQHPGLEDQTRNEIELCCVAAGHSLKGLRRTILLVHKLG